MTFAAPIPLASARFGRRSFGATPLGRLLGWLGAREDRRRLHSLSDHLLSDIGIMRDQIDDILKGGMRRM